MGQTTSVPSTTHDERHVKRQRRHSSHAAATEEMDRGSRRVSSRHSRTGSGSSTHHSQKHSRELSSHHDKASTVLPGKTSPRSSRSSTSRQSDTLRPRSKDVAAAREKIKRPKPKMDSSAQTQTPEAATRLIKRRDKAAFEVQSAIQMLGKYGAGADTSLIHLSIEDIHRLEAGFKRIRDLLDSISASIEQYDSRLASKLLANKALYIHTKEGFSDLGRIRTMLRRITRDLQKVESYTLATRFKASPKFRQPRSSMASSNPGLWTPEMEIKFSSTPSNTSDNVAATQQDDLVLPPESWYTASVAQNLSKVEDQVHNHSISLAGPSRTIESSSKASSSLTGTVDTPIDLTSPKTSVTESTIKHLASTASQKNVEKFRSLTSDMVEYPRLPTFDQDATGKGKAKEDIEPMASNLKKRLAALRKSTAETLPSRNGTPSVNFSRPLIAPLAPALPPPVSSEIRPPLVEKRNAWAGNLPSPNFNEVVERKNQIRAEQEALTNPATRFSLTVLPALTDVPSYMQLSNVDIIEFAVVDADRKPIEGHTWISSAPSQTMKLNDAECITMIRNHAAGELKADPRAICLWYTTIPVSHLEFESRNITALSKQRVNVFLDPYIRLVASNIMHAIDYSKRATAEKVPINKACVTVGELRKRAETQLDIQKRQRVKLSYQGVILYDDKAELKEACSLSQKICEGWEPLYIDVEIETKRDCVVCGDELSATRFPLRPITSTCDHEYNTCRKCVREWIKSSLKTNGPDKLKCTECPAQLKHADVKAHASSRQFEKYDTFLTRSVVNADPDFHWCISTSCNSGHIHISATSGPIFTCTSCSLRQCTQHITPWHVGETCEQYDYRKTSTKRWKEEERASEKTISETTKPCPKCKAHIEKNDGCDHMTCRKCRHEYCWICLVDYEPIRNVGNSMHDARCLHYRGMPTMPPVPRRR